MEFVLPIYINAPSQRHAEKRADLIRGMLSHSNYESGGPVGFALEGPGPDGEIVNHRVGELKLVDSSP